MTGREGPALLGAVLAGGRSRRFGSDKARAELGGRSFLRRSVDALEPSVVRVGVVLGAGDGTLPADAVGVPVRRDRTAARGPLEGLRVALTWAAEEGLEGAVVLACDVPLIDAATVAALVRAWEGHSADAPDGVVPVAGGRLQPLVAVYAVGVLPAVEERLRGGDGSLRGLVRALRLATPDAADLLAAEGGLDPADRFLNVNTPADRARARALPGEGRRGRRG